MPPARTATSAAPARSPARGRRSPRWPAAAGLQVEVLTADHQNKADIGAGIARQWLDQGVDALLEFNNSAIALAVNNLVRERDKVMLANNVGSAALSGKECTPNMTHWTFDTAMLAISMGNGMVEQGGDTWFFIRADYTFGRALRDDTAAVVQAKGSKVVGEVAVPVGTTDFASALLQAQASKAKVVALALAGGDLLNCLKQAGEFGLGRGGQRVAALIIYLQDIKSLGLAGRQGHHGDRIVLLGPERPVARFRQARAAQHQGHSAEHGPGRRLLGGDALPEGGGRPRSPPRRSNPGARSWRA